MTNHIRALLAIRKAIRHIMKNGPDCDYAGICMNIEDRCEIFGSNPGDLPIDSTVSGLMNRAGLGEHYPFGGSAVYNDSAIPKWEGFWGEQRYSALELMLAMIEVELDEAAQQVEGE